MTFLRDLRGGLLWEVFVAVSLASVGAGLWWMWQEGSWGTWTGPRTDSGVPAPFHAAAWERSLWLTQQINDVLDQHGVGENDIVRATHRENRQGASRWLLRKVVVQSPKRFSSEKFLNDLTTRIAEKKFQILRNHRAAGVWELNIGEPGRIFGQVVFRG